MYPPEQLGVLTCNNIRGLLSIERLSDTTTGWALRAFLSFALPVGTRPVSDVRSMSNAHAVVCLLTGQAPVSGLATKAATPDPLLQSPANHGAQFGGRETSFRQI